MNKKQYNAIVEECRSTTCYHCGFTKQCNRLEEVGLQTPMTKYWSELSEENKEKVMKG